MDFLDDKLQSTSGRSRKVHAWYLYEQYKSLQRNQAETALQLKKKTSQNAMLRVMSDHRQRRRMCSDCHSKSSTIHSIRHGDSRFCVTCSIKDLFERFCQSDEFLDPDETYISTHESCRWNQVDKEPLSSPELFKTTNGCSETRRYEDSIPLPCAVLKSSTGHRSSCSSNNPANDLERALSPYDDQDLLFAPSNGNLSANAVVAPEVFKKTSEVFKKKSVCSEQKRYEDSILLPRVVLNNSTGHRSSCTSNNLVDELERAFSTYDDKDLLLASSTGNVSADRVIASQLFEKTSVCSEAKRYEDSMSPRAILNSLPGSRSSCTSNNLADELEGAFTTYDDKDLLLASSTGNVSADRVVAPPLPKKTSVCSEPKRYEDSILVPRVAFNSSTGHRSSCTSNNLVGELEGAFTTYDDKDLLLGPSTGNVSADRVVTPPLLKKTSVCSEPKRYEDSILLPRVAFNSSTGHRSSCTSNNLVGELEGAFTTYDDKDLLLGPSTGNVSADRVVAPPLLKKTSVCSEPKRYEDSILLPRVAFNSSSGHRSSCTSKNLVGELEGAFTTYDDKDLLLGPSTGNVSADRVVTPPLLKKTSVCSEPKQYEDSILLPRGALNSSTGHRSSCTSNNHVDELERAFSTYDDKDLLLASSTGNVSADRVVAPPLLKKTSVCSEPKQYEDSILLPRGALNSSTGHRSSCTSNNHVDELERAFSTYDDKDLLLASSTGNVSADRVVATQFFEKTSVCSEAIRHEDSMSPRVILDSLPGSRSSCTSNNLAGELEGAFTTYDDKDLLLGPSTGNVSPDRVVAPPLLKKTSVCSEHKQFNHSTGHRSSCTSIKLADELERAFSTYNVVFAPSTGNLTEDRTADPDRAVLLSVTSSKHANEGAFSVAISNSNLADDIKEELENVKRIIVENIHHQIEMKQNVQSLEGFTNFKDPKCYKIFPFIDQVINVTDDEGLSLRLHRGLSDKHVPNHNSFDLWTKLVSFAYQVTQLNHGNCYDNYSSILMTVVLACDVIKRGIGLVCNVLQPYVSPIKYVNGLPNSTDTMKNSKSTKTTFPPLTKNSKFVIKGQKKPMRSRGGKTLCLKESPRRGDTASGEQTCRADNMTSSDNSTKLLLQHDAWQSLSTYPSVTLPSEKYSSTWHEELNSRGSFNSCSTRVTNPMLNIATYIDSIIKDVDNPNL